MKKNGKAIMVFATESQYNGWMKRVGKYIPKTYTVARVEKASQFQGRRGAKNIYLIPLNRSCPILAKVRKNPKLKDQGIDPDLFEKRVIERSQADRAMENMISAAYGTDKRKSLNEKVI